MLLLVKMLPLQAVWLEENVLKPFEKENNVVIRLQNFQAYQDLERIVSQNAAFDVVKIPMDRAGAFRANGNIWAVSAVADRALQDSIRSAYLLPPLAVGGDTIWYLPRKLETRIMVYRISKVREALSAYRAMLPEINMAVAKINRKGLPTDYVLEENPDNWDYYDVLVAGYVWNKQNKGRGRVGHRSKNYEGTMLRVVDRAFQLGATRGEIPYLTSRPVTEAFEWEYAYARLHVYNALMFEQEWTGRELWQVFGAEQIFLTFLTQIDCFFLLGNGDKKMPGFAKDAEDVGFACMPKGASLSGEEALFVNRNVTTGGWFWAIGKESPNKALALRLMLYMTSADIQEKEFNEFGTFPTRHELLKTNPDKLYMKRWQNRVLQTSLKQVEVNRYTIFPTFQDAVSMQNRYYKVLRELCVKPERFTSLDQVKKVLADNDMPPGEESQP